VGGEEGSWEQLGEEEKVVAMQLAGVAVGCCGAPLQEVGSWLASLVPWWEGFCFSLFSPAGRRYLPAGLKEAASGKGRLCLRVGSRSPELLLVV